MKEEDKIAEIVNSTEIKSFDIKQEWLDDISTQLDAYNAKKRKKRYLWFLMIPAILIPIFLYTFSGSKTQPVAKSNHTLAREITEHNTTKTKIEKTGDKSAMVEQPNYENTLSLKNETTPKVQKPLHPAKDQLAAKNKQDTTPKHQRKLKTGLGDHPKNSAGNKADKQPNQAKQSNTDNTDQFTDRTDLVTKKTANSSENNGISASESISSQALTNSSAQTNEAGIRETDNNTATIVPDTEAIKESKSEPEKIASSEQSSKESTVQEVANDENTTPEIEAPIEIAAEANGSANEAAIVDSSANEVQPQGSVDEIANTTDDDLKIDDKKGSKDKLWSIGFTLGPDFLTKDLTSNSDYTNFEKKKTEEIFNNTWGVDFEINRYLTPWLTLGTGLNYKKYVEVNAYSPSIFTISDTTTTISTNTTLNYVPFVQMDTIYLLDSLTNDTIGTTINTTQGIDTVEVTESDTTFTVKNKTSTDTSKNIANGPATSTYFQIPISTQLIFVNTKRLTAYTNLSLLIGVLTKNSGLVIDYATNDIVNYKSRDLILNSVIGLGFNYKLIGPLDYKLYGSYQFSLSNFSLTPNIDKRYNGLNIRTGIVFHF